MWRAERWRTARTLDDSLRLDFTLPGGATISVAIPMIEAAQAADRIRAEAAKPPENRPQGDEIDHECHAVRRHQPAMIDPKKILEGVPGLIVMAACTLVGVALGFSLALSTAFWIKASDGMANF